MQSPVAASCDSAPVSKRIQPLPRPSSRNKFYAVLASEQSSTNAPPTSPCLRNKNRFPTCESTHPPASESQRPLRDGNVQSTPPQSPRKNRRTRCHRHLPPQFHVRALPPSDTSGCKRE